MPSNPAKTNVCLRVFGRFLLDNGSLDGAKWPPRQVERSRMAESPSSVLLKCIPEAPPEPDSLPRAERVWELAQA